MNQIHIIDITIENMQIIKGYFGISYFEVKKYKVMERDIIIGKIINNNFI
jgi:hypothetical protein